MNVNSFSFVVFVAILAFIYYFPVIRKVQWVVLLVASYVFYAQAGIERMVYIMITTLVTYTGARLLERKNLLQEEFVKNGKGVLPKEEIKAYKEKVKRQKHRITFWCIVLNLGLLIFLKYGAFLAGNTGRIFGHQEWSELSFFQLAVPLGISYYTLMSIGYLLDVSKGKCKSEKNLLKVALFISYFPQITQGPFGRFPDMASQLFANHKFTYEKLANGCRRMLWGFFKKMVIADRMKPMVDTIFDNYQTYGGFTLLLGCMYFSIQLYADFSGYMDIVAGCSELFGIHLAENFKRPFLSKSLDEYWRRWHITLCAWFRDYVFYPLSISKAAVKVGRVAKKVLPLRIAKLTPSIFAMMVVWFCTGLWHDASWRYMLWGIYNGSIIVASMCLKPQFACWKEKLHIKEGKLWHGFQMIRTFLIISLLKVFPLAATTGDSLAILKKIFIEFPTQFSIANLLPGMGMEDLFCVSVGLMIFAFVSLRQEKEPMRNYLSRRSVAVRWLAYMVLLLFVVSFGVFGNGLTGGFEYAQY